MQRHRGAVDPRGSGFADAFLNPADGLFLKAVAGVGILSGRKRSGETRDQVSGHHRAALAHQRRRLREIKITLDQNLRAVRANKK